MNDKKKFSIKAVIIGWLVDVIGSMIFGAVLAIIFLIIFFVKRGNLQELLITGLEQFKEQVAGSIAILIPSLIGGLFFTTLGGYVAARIAKFSELKHALGVGLLSVLYGIIIVIIAPQPVPVWYYPISFTLVIPCALLGGHLRVITVKRKVG